MNNLTITNAIAACGLRADHAQIAANEITRQVGQYDPDRAGYELTINIDMSNWNEVDDEVGMTQALTQLAIATINIRDALSETPDDTGRLQGMRGGEAESALERIQVGLTGESTETCDWYEGIGFDGLGELRKAIS